MRKIKLNYIKNILSVFFAIIIFASFFVGINPIYSAAAENKITIDSSKFLYSPSYSTIYNDKLYFIDNHNGNKYFKIFITKNNEITYADSSTILNFEVVDAFIINNYFIILSKDSIKYLDLDSDNTEFLNLTTIPENSYNSIFIYSKDNEYIITLTPKSFETTNPLIIIQNFKNSQTNSFEINDNYLKSHSQDASFIVSNLATIKTENDLYYLIYFGGQKFEYILLQFFPHNDFNQSEEPTSFLNASLLDTNPDISIENINLIKCEEETEVKEYFLITYKKTIAASKTEYYSKLYNFDFKNKIFKFISFADGFDSITTSPFITSNNNTIIYEENKENPQIKYFQITSNQSITTYSFENPLPEINEFDHMKYMVKTTNEEVNLLKNPWDLSSNIKIEPETDILVVGTPIISDAEIENLYYCLYTSVDSNSNYINNYGYISAQQLSDKETITLEDLSLAKTVKVFADTIVYSLPTKISTNKLKTDGNFAVEIIDTLNGYKTGTTQWIKVQLSGIVGYIDISKINYSTDKINYISTNATILKDNTYVYSQPKSNSTLIYNQALNKGKTVLIVGTRDTKTGYTKIKFNDDYGNEFEGYVKTENIKSDSWSQLQIIGSILIAINTGILILILVFKNKKLKNINNKPKTINDEY